MGPRREPGPRGSEGGDQTARDFASREAPAIEVPKEKVGEEDDMLAARLRALRPAT